MNRPYGIADEERTHRAPSTAPAETATWRALAIAFALGLLQSIRNNSRGRRSLVVSRLLPFGLLAISSALCRDRADGSTPPGPGSWHGGHDGARYPHTRSVPERRPGTAAGALTTVGTAAGLERERPRRSRRLHG